MTTPLSNARHLPSAVTRTGRVNNADDVSRLLPLDRVEAGTALLARVAVLEARPGGATVTNVVFVDKAGSDSTGARGQAGSPFLTVQAAVTAALAGDVVVINPGVYVENVVCKSGVHLTGTDRMRTRIQGNVSWLPTAASSSLVPDPFSDPSDVVMLSHLTITGTLTVNGTGKLTSEISTCELLDVNVPTINLSSHAARFTSLGLRNCGTFIEGGAADVNITSGFVIIVGFHSALNSLTASTGYPILYNCNVSEPPVLSGDASLTMYGGILFGGLTTTSSAEAGLEGVAVDGPITVGAASKVSMPGSSFVAESFAVTAGGEVNRDKITGSVPSTTAGDHDNTVTFAVPLMDNDFVVMLAETTSTPAGILPSVKSKSKTGFVLHDTVGGRTYDYVVHHHNT